MEATLRSKQFKRLTNYLLLVVSVFFLVGTCLLIRQKIAESNKKIQTSIDALAFSMEKSLESLRTETYLMSSMKSMEQIMRNPSPSMDDYVSITNELFPYLNKINNQTIELFFLQAETVYISNNGLYQKDTYPDSALWNALETPSSMGEWHYRTFELPFQNKKCNRFITYTQVSPSYSNVHFGVVASSLPVSDLLLREKDKLTIPWADNNVFFANQLLYSSNEAFFTAYDNKRTYNENMESFYPSGRRDFISQSQGQISVQGTVSFAESLRMIRPTLVAALYSYLVLCIVSLVGSFLYTRWRLHYIHQIMGKFGQVEDDLANYSDKNRMELIEASVDALLNKMRVAENTIEHHTELVKSHVINNIIDTPVSLFLFRKSNYKYNIDFPHTNFAVLLVSVDALARTTDSSLRERQGIAVEQSALLAFSPLGKAYSTGLREREIVLLINYRESPRIEKEITELGRTFCATIYKELSLSPLLSVGLCDPRNPIPYIAYGQAKQNLIYAYEDKDEFILFSHQSHYATVVDKNITNALVQSVLNKDEELLKDSLSQLKSVGIEEKNSLENTKKLTYLYGSSIVSDLLSNDYLLKLAEVSALFQTLEKAATSKQCENILCTFFYSLCRSDTRIPIKGQYYVDTALAIIKERYYQDISIPDIAEKCEVHPVYLNKLFKQSTGKTISEHLNYYRIEQSLDYLAKTDYSISSISQKIGYHDSRSYSRFFRKYYGITPGEWRAKLAKEP